MVEETGFESVSLDVGSSKDEVKHRQEKNAEYEAQCARIYEELRGANEVLVGKLGIEVELEGIGLGFLLRETYVQKHKEDVFGKKSTEVALVFTPSQILEVAYLNGRTISGFDGPEQLEELMRKRNLPFFPFRGEAEILQETISRAKEAALPRLPSSDPNSLGKVKV